MIDYEKKYKDYTEGLFQCIPDVSQEYPDCNGFEKCVIAFRREGWTYGGIQHKLGMPSKKQIRDVLLKWAPELIDNSRNKSVPLVSEYEAELYKLIRDGYHHEFNVFGEEWYFFIENNKLKYVDESGYVGEFGTFPINEQAQILDEIKK